MRKRIVCFGDSNTWGYDAKANERFAEHIRWPCLLGELLGDGYQVIEEGLSGRTSVSEDPLFEGLCGYSYIHACLMSHSPIELVIIMLGTNDTKERFNLTSFNIAQGIARLAKKAKDTAAGEQGNGPRVLVVSPPPIREGYYKTNIGPAMGRGCDQKSLEFPKYLEDLLNIQGIEHLNTRGNVQMNDIDFMHLDEIGHKQLSTLIFNKIKNTLKEL